MGSFEAIAKVLVRDDLLTARTAVQDKRGDNAPLVFFDCPLTSAVRTGDADRDRRGRRRTHRCVEREDAPR
jgi:hypothetical protein